MVKTLFVSMLAIFACLFLPAQCIVAPPAPPTTGTEPLAASGQTISVSQSKWFYGSPQTFTSLTLDGGTLVVSGDLTINTFNFNSGVIIVRPGASLTITSGPSLIMPGNSYVYNYGKIVLQRGLVLNNTASATQPNVFINAGASSVFEMLFDWMVINNPYSWFVNEGKASMHGIVTDPQSAVGSVCLGDRSQVYMSTLINNAPKTYAVPSGAACVAVTDHAYICESVTASATLNICMGPSGGTDSGCLMSHGKTKAWGPAQLFNGCTTCGAIAILPVHTPDNGHAANPVRDVAAMLEPEIYPNPFMSVLVVHLPAGQTAEEVTLMNIVGNVVLRAKTAGSREILVQGSGIPAGCYLLRVVTKKKVYLRSVLKR